MKPSSSPSHGGHNFPLIFAGGQQGAITLVESVLRLPCNFFDFFAEPLLAFAESGSDGGSVSVAPGRLHQNPTQVSIASLSNGTALYPFSTGILARHRPAVPHELSSPAETGNHPIH